MSLAVETVSFDYRTWGLKDALPKEVRPLAPEKITALTRVAVSLVDLSGYQLAETGKVKHYQGVHCPSANIGLLRFTPTGTCNLHSEHISLAIDLDKHVLMGLTRMQRQVVGTQAEDVSHELALARAFEFLKLNAPDLISADAVLPALPDAPFAGSKLDFEHEPLVLGKLEVHWIGDHKESMVVDGTAAEFHGMKVKMYIPETELWAWAVVDKMGAVNTFERNISWDFVKFQRETQMWLHDQWLEKQGIRLYPVIEGEAIPRSERDISEGPGY